MSHGRGSILWPCAVFLAGLAFSTACSRARSNLVSDPQLDLRSPVETMTGAQLWDALTGIKWAHGPDDDRKCGATGDKECRARFDMAYIVMNGQPIRPDPWNGTTNGTIVGRIVNTGSPKLGWNVGSEFRYKVGIRGGDRHFIVIATNRAGARQYWVREVTPTDQGRTSVATGTWINCNHSGGPKPVKSRFANCDEAHSIQRYGSASMSLHSHELSPGWMECASSGCCTAGDSSLER